MKITTRTIGESSIVVVESDGLGVGEYEPLENKQLRVWHYLTDSTTIKTTRKQAIDWLLEKDLVGIEGIDD